MAETKTIFEQDKMSSMTGPPSSQADERPDQTNSTYAFLVHSTETLTNNLPPNVDNKPLARQKRRRTSPEDQAILETEYTKNPKPDKAARMAIVQRVALGEKEVQIWFQNRRQSSRRKSRPLLPHEIAEYQKSRVGSIGFMSGSDAESGLRLPKVEGDGSQDHLEQDEEAEDVTELDSEARGDAERSAEETPQTQSKTPGSRLTDPALEMLSTVIPSSQDSAAGTVGYLANRRSTAPRQSQGEIDEEVVPGSQQDTKTSSENLESRKQLRRASSYVRLSMTADGVAKVITQDDYSPSPPRKRHSDILPSSAPAAVSTETATTTLDGVTPRTSQEAQGLRRKPSGRSRDSRAWEFWCDRDARSQLEEKADQEASGSAADAIGLIRSSSGRNVLGTLTGKRQPPERTNSVAKRSRTDRAPLNQRSQSSQNKQTPKQRLGTKIDFGSSGKRKAVSGLGIQMPGTDSDKENWSPERFMIPEHGAKMPAPSSAVSRRASQRSASPLKPGLNSGKIVFDTPQILDNSEDDDEEEVADFMQRGRQSKSNSVSEEEELDCVQGLLSLSQGNWR